MRLRVLFFGPLADQTGRREDLLELAGHPRAADVYGHYRQLHPALGTLGRDLLLAVNQDFSTPDAELRDGDEIAFLPPMSGGAPSAGPELVAGRYAALVRAPIQSAALRALVDRPEHGAIACFEGVVRNHHRGKAVRYLEYEAYEPMALKRMQAIASEVLARWPVGAVALVHRLGRLQIGEVSVVVAVGSAHRQPAFAACAFAIDTLKESVPIWKKEWGADGAEWVEGALPRGCGAEHGVK